MKQHISISDIPSTSLLIKDYLKTRPELSQLYGRKFTYENLLEQSREKLSLYKHRTELVKELTAQLKQLSLSDKQKENIQKLSLDNTVTITTGHQLNLMTGPLYFIYKILHVIKLCDSMNEKQKEINFVPVFWMATEDHDFKEINHFYFQGKKIEWKEEHNDFVGEISTDILKKVLTPFYENLKYFPKGKELREIIEKSYFTEKNMASATKALVHEIFKEYGLLFIDGNSPVLKRLFIPCVKEDLIHQQSYHTVSKTINVLQHQYKIQVNPREINFFYRENNERNRIEKFKDSFFIHGTDKKFTEKEILEELTNSPEKFSPNALMRPVYQETILPNAAYIGGNAEIAYWLELKEYFNSQSLSFPILIPRNSFLILNENQNKKLQKFHITYLQLFKNKEMVIKEIIKKHSSFSFDFDTYHKRLSDIFADLLNEGKQTDPNWKNMILAQQKKQLNGLEKINHRFYKAEKKKYMELASTIENLYSELFPKGTWQERVENFAFYYANMNTCFLQLIYEQTTEFEPSINFVNI